MNMAAKLLEHVSADVAERHLHDESVANFPDAIIEMKLLYFPINLTSVFRTH